MTGKKEERKTEAEGEKGRAGAKRILLGSSGRFRGRQAQPCWLEGLSFAHLVPRCLFWATPARRLFRLKRWVRP